MTKQILMQSEMHACVLAHLDHTNEPCCLHPGFLHDVSGDDDNPAPMCCVEGCDCGPTNLKGPSS